MLLSFYLSIYKFYSNWRGEVNEGIPYSFIYLSIVAGSDLEFEGMRHSTLIEILLYKLIINNNTISYINYNIQKTNTTTI